MPREEADKIVVGFDFTLAAAACSPPELMVFLNEWCKKWVFQKEEASTGYLHYQCRVHLYVKQRVGEINAKTQELWAGPPFHSRHWSVTCKKVHEGTNFNYVQKADGRVDGPWKDTDYEEPPVLTRQLRTFNAYEFHPWQNTVYNWVSEEDDRFIKLIVDTEGNAGKSVFAEYLEYHGFAYDIPAFRMMEDIMQCVMSIKTKKAYLVDMPRAMKKDRLSDFYSGLECLKNGVAFDKRYAFKKRRFDRPQVIVFSNKLPDWNAMSLDRWQVFRMEDKALVPVPPLTTHLF